MELLEPNDPKEQLLKKSAMYRQHMEEGVENISDQMERIITNALIIAGTLVTAYLIVRQFSSSSQKKKTKSQKIKLMQSLPDESQVTSEKESTEPSVVSQIGTALASQAAIFLLDLAKEKLSEYIEGQLGNKGENHERS